MNTTTVVYCAPSTPDASLCRWWRSLKMSAQGRTWERVLDTELHPYGPLQSEHAWGAANSACRVPVQVEEDPEDEVARTDPWEVFGFRLHPGEEVVCRVHQVRTLSEFMLQRDWACKSSPAACGFLWWAAKCCGAPLLGARPWSLSLCLTAGANENYRRVYLVQCANAAGTPYVIGCVFYILHCAPGCGHGFQALPRPPPARPARLQPAHITKQAGSLLVCAVLSFASMED